MPTAFFRSPADSLAGVPVQDKLRRRRRGLLRMEDSDQDVGQPSRPMVRAGDGKVGGGIPQKFNLGHGDDRRRLQFESGTSARRTGTRPQDTKYGVVGQGDDNPAAGLDGLLRMRVADSGKTGSIGQEPNERDENGGIEPTDRSGQEQPRDVGGSMFPVEPFEREEMSAGEVQSAMHKMVWDAIEYIDQELSPFRAMATQYYKGEPFGNEEDGRSQFIMTTVRDTILQIMPSLLRIFFGPEYAVEFAPDNASQIEAAEQMTAFVWEKIVKEDNRGFLAFYEWFKDALLKRLGIMKYWYDKSSETLAFSNTFMSEEQVHLLFADDTIRIDSIQPTPGVRGMFDVEYTQTKTDGKIRFIALPPEEFLFTRGARTTDSDHSQPGVALFVGHRTELTRSQLLELGVSEEDIEAWAFKDVSLDHNQEEIARQNIVKPDTSAIGPIATQKALYIEGYPYIDVDGDGVAELRRVIMLGPAYHVISNEPCDERPFAVISPDPEPHTIIGQAVSDWTMDLQLLTSSLVRAMNDSLALAINPRMGYVEGDVNLNDILNPEIGAPIRMRQQGALQEITHQFVGAPVLQVLELFNDVREQRSGVTKASAGLDADALQSSTKAAVAATITAAQQHIETIARCIAETGVTKLFRGILKLAVANPQRDRIVKMRGEYTEVDPRSWDATLSVQIKVAIGGGLQDEKAQAIDQQLTKMEGILNMMGLQNPIVSIKQYRDMLVRGAKVRGFMDAESWYSDPPKDWQPPQPQAQDPNMVIAQAEQQKAGAEVQKKQADQQLDMAKHQHTIEKSQVDQQLKDKEIMLTDARERARIELEYQLKVRELELDHQLRTEELRLKAELDHKKAAADHLVKKAAQETESAARDRESRATAAATREGGGDQPA